MSQSSQILTNLVTLRVTTTHYLGTLSLSFSISLSHTLSLSLSFTVTSQRIIAVSFIQINIKLTSKLASRKMKFRIDKMPIQICKISKFSFRTMSPAFFLQKRFCIFMAASNSSGNPFRAENPLFATRANSQCLQFCLDVGSTY